MPIKIQNNFLCNMYPVIFQYFHISDITTTSYDILAGTQGELECAVGRVNSTDVVKVEWLEVMVNTSGTWHKALLHDPDYQIE